MTDVDRDCLAFRRQVGATPDEPDAALQAHERSCPACAAFAREQRALDRRLQVALRLDVPAELPARVIWRQAARRRLPRRLALAAGFVLVAGLGLVLAQLLPPAVLPAGPLVADVVAHIEHEPDLLLPTSARAEPVRVRAVLTRGGVELPEPLPDVVHAGLCPFRGHLVPHLVVNVDGEPVSVLVLANETVTRAEAIHVDGYDGIVVPNGQGSIAIVAPRPDLIAPVRARFDTVRWTAI